MYVAIMRHTAQTSADTWNVLSSTKICTPDTSLGEIMEWAEKYKEENFNVEISKADDANPTPELEFKRGDKVAVRDNKNDRWNRKYFFFSHYNPNDTFPYHCFKRGKDEWSSYGETMGWKYCKKWEEE